MLSMLSQSLHRSLIYWQSGNTEEGKDGSHRNKYSVIHRLSECSGRGAAGEGCALDNAAAVSGGYCLLFMHVNNFAIHTYYVKTPYD